MGVNLAGIEAPFFVSVLCEPTAASLVECCRQSRAEGAGIAEINLAQLSDDEFERLAAAGGKLALPCYLTCRRREFMQVYRYNPAHLRALSDDQRVARQLQMLHWGVGVDVEFDIFDGPQRRDDLIGQVHDQGKAAIVSCHTGQALDPGATEDLARSIRGCGADACKIIHTHTEESYVPQLLESIRRLRAVLDVPFVLLSMGPGSTALRHLAIQAGCSYAFGRASGALHYYEGHPPLQTLERTMPCGGATFSV